MVDKQRVVLKQKKPDIYASCGVIENKMQDSASVSANLPVHCDVRPNVPGLYTISSISDDNVVLSTTSPPSK